MFIAQQYMVLVGRVFWIRFMLMVRFLPTTQAIRSIAIHHYYHHCSVLISVSLSFSSFIFRFSCPFSVLGCDGGDEKGSPLSIALYYYHPAECCATVPDVAALQADKGFSWCSRVPGRSWPVNQSISPQTCVCALRLLPCAVSVSLRRTWACVGTCRQ
jgi:hypothetical protein